MADEAPARSTESTVAKKPSLAKKALHFLLSVAIALVIGKALELADRDNIAALERVQQRALDAVGAFDPWNIFRSYVCNVEAAGVGGDACSPVPRREAEGLNPFAAPQPRPTGGLGILAPVAALFATIWQLLAQPSAIGTLLAFLQFAAGAFLMIWGSRGERKEAPYYLFFFPVGTVAIACILGWAVQLVMLAGLGLFKGFTDIAGLCCGSGSLAYLGYQFCLKAVEVKASTAAEKTLIKG